MFVFRLVLIVPRDERRGILFDWEGRQNIDPPLDWGLDRHFVNVYNCFKSGRREFGMVFGN